jgi:hypothetical protein
LSSSQHRSHAYIFFLRLLLRQTQRLGQCRQVAAQVGGRVSEDEQQSCVVSLIAPGVFHCQARFAYTVKAVDRLAGNNGCGSA